MTFDSWHFAVFLAVVVTLYWSFIGWRNVRLTLLLAASLFFFGSYQVWFLGLLAFSAILDFFCGRWIARGGTPRARLFALVASLVGNLSLLCYFKYSVWMADGLDPLLQEMGFSSGLMRWAWQEAVPVGISFYTFQTLSYSIDIYRGVLKPVKSLRDFALFVSFFPQLVAGPIVRAIDFLPQLKRPPILDRIRLHEGLYRISIGLAKKVLIADFLGRYLVDPVYARPELYGPEAHVIALYAFAFQIYCDFAGYSDIAIGTAKLFGFDIKENFLGPYRSKSVREFWRRWHISLSSWVRDYIFFPLGGSRGRESRVSANLLITMVIIGVWHGASMLWVMYGVCQGVAMIVERALERWRGGKEFANTALRRAISWLLTFHFIVLTCIFIRAENWGEATAIVSTFGDRGLSHFDVLGLVALAAAMFTHFSPVRLTDGFHDRMTAMPTVFVGVVMGILVGFVALLSVGATPFIYFQF